MSSNARLPTFPEINLLADASLFVDFDGTLVELVDRPEKVTVDQSLRDLLGLLGAALPGRIAIVSGRSIAQLDHFLGDSMRGFALAGSHGSERRDGHGNLELPEIPAGLASAGKALLDFAKSHPGTLVEEKTYGVALHYRMAPQIEPLVRVIAARVAAEHGLEVQPGKMMMDLKIVGGNKGDAIRSFMRSPPMAGTCPWFIGDDLTDEKGFEVARELGGGGILVGSARTTAATYRLDDVNAVRRWLAEAWRAMQ